MKKQDFDEEEVVELLGDSSTEEEEGLLEGEENEERSQEPNLSDQDPQSTNNRIDDFIGDIEFSEEEEEQQQDGIEEETENERNQRALSKVLRISYFVYLFCLITPIVPILAISKPSECDEPLFFWLVGLICFHVFSILLNLNCYCLKIRYDSTGARDLFYRVCLRRNTYYLFHALLAMIYIFWWIIGMIWVFRSDTECKHNSRVLYFLSLSLIVIHLSFIGLLLVCCCCSLVCVGVLYIVNPDALRASERTPGASKKVIEALESKKYFPGLISEDDDTKCAICLNNYQTDEVIRFLPCLPKKHHFHSDCVDSWLKINKSCPFCKQLVDSVKEEGEKNDIEGDVV